jgi:hypothetical protein
LLFILKIFSLPVSTCYLTSNQIPPYATESLWTSVPAEIAVEIFGLLDTNTLLNCREVCRTWAALCTHAPVQALDLPTGCSEAQLSVLLATFPRARTLRVPSAVAWWHLSLWRRLANVVSGGGVQLDLSRVQQWQDLEDAADIASRSGHLSLAIQLLDAALRISPMDVQLLLSRATLLQKTGQLAGAEKDLREVPFSSFHKGDI